jgi:hypothetical protein
MKISYIIPYTDSIENLKLLRNSINILKKYSSIEIIIVESGQRDKLSSYSLPGVRTIFIKSNNYNRFWNINIGIKNATENIIVIGDVNWMVNPNYLLKSLNNLDKFNYIGLYNKVINVQTGEQFGFNITEDPNRTKSDINFLEGVSIFKKDFILSRGLFDETFFDIEKSLWINRKKFNNPLIEENIGIHLNVNSIGYTNDLDRRRDISNFSKLSGLEDIKLENWFKHSKLNGMNNKYSV